METSEGTFSRSSGHPAAKEGKRSRREVSDSPETPETTPQKRQCSGSLPGPTPTNTPMSWGKTGVAGAGAAAAAAAARERRRGQHGLLNDRWCCLCLSRVRTSAARGRHTAPWGRLQRMPRMGRTGRQHRERPLLNPQTTPRRPMSSDRLWSGLTPPTTSRRLATAPIKNSARRPVSPDRREPSPSPSLCLLPSP